MTNNNQGDRLKQLLQTLQVTQREFAERLGISQGAVSQLISGRTTLSYETLQRVQQAYKVNLNWLVTGQGEPFGTGSGSVPATTQAPASPILAVTVDQHDNPNIVMVPVKAQAGYVANRLEPNYLRELPAFNLPMDRFKQGTYRGFEVAGDSMEPGLFQGDLLICSYVEDARYLRDMNLYVFVTPGDVLVKRVRNLLKQEGRLELLSDNTFYPPIDLAPQELQEVWQVYARITLHFRAPGQA